MQRKKRTFKHPQSREIKEKQTNRKTRSAHEKKKQCTHNCTRKSTCKRTRKHTTWGSTQRHTQANRDREKQAGYQGTRVHLREPPVRLSKLAPLPAAPDQLARHLTPQRGPQQLLHLSLSLSLPLQNARRRRGGEKAASPVGVRTRGAPLQRSPEWLLWYAGGRATACRGAKEGVPVLWPAAAGGREAQAEGVAEKETHGGGGHLCVL